MMTTHKKLSARILSLALSAIVTTMLPATAFAEKDDVQLGASSIGVSPVATIQSFDQLEDRFIPSTGENAPGHIYVLSVALNTQTEDLQLPVRLHAMVERTTTATDGTVSGNEPVASSSGAEKEVMPDESTPFAPEPEQEKINVSNVEQESIAVTWTSDKEYKSDVNGKFIYTAVLPEGYTLADSVKLPQIYIMVGRQARATGSHDISTGALTLTSDDGCSEGAPHTITGTTKEHYIRLNNSSTHYVTLGGVSIDKPYWTETKESPIMVTGSGAVLYLTLAEGTSSTLIGDEYLPGIKVTNESSIIINGTGTLTATGGFNAAGIGGADEDLVANITINSGTVTANGGLNGAGIGSGNGGAGGNISITGGTVTANGNYASGIGGGMLGAGGTVSITGGTVTANGGMSCYGIGGMDLFTLLPDGDIKISNAAKVTAYSVTAGNAIGDTDSIITPDSGTAASLMQFDFALATAKDTTIEVKNSSGTSLSPKVSCVPTVEFQSLALTAPATGDYTAYQGADKLKFTPTGGSASEAFAVVAGLNKYTDVLGPDVTIAKALTIGTVKPASTANIANGTNTPPTGANNATVTWSADGGSTFAAASGSFSENIAYQTKYVYTAKTGYAFDSGVAATDITVTNLGTGTKTATLSTDNKTLTIVVTWPATAVLPAYNGTQAAAPGSTPQSKTETQIVLTAVTVAGESIEYAYSTTGTAPTADADWQGSTKFKSLTKGTTYYFFARVKANTTHKAGMASTGTAIATVGAATVTGIPHNLSTDGALELNIDFDQLPSEICNKGCTATKPHVVTSNGSTDKTITLAEGDHYVVLSNVTISSATSPISLEKREGILDLTLKGTNTLTAMGDGKAGIFVQNGAEDAGLTIHGGKTDSLTVQGGKGAAGIGGNVEAPCGCITINGGIINATGGESGAGIGSGTKQSSVDYAAYITINDGTITATGGGNGAAGIGRSDHDISYAGDLDIIINGGNVTAVGTGVGGELSEQGSAPGIGTLNQGTGITIKGGIVNAQGDGSVFNAGNNALLTLTDTKAKHKVSDGSYTGATNITGCKIYEGAAGTAKVAKDVKVMPVYKGTEAASVSGTPAAKTGTSVTIAAVTAPTGEAIEYAYSTTSTAPATGWQDSTAFTGLTAGTQYYFFARVKAGDKHWEGASSTGTAITTVAVAFVPVTGITGVPTMATAGTPLTLSGTVAPTNATNKTIVWTVKSAGATGATISGSTVSTTAAGTVTVAATITNGLTAGSNYTQEFTITVSKSDAEKVASAKAAAVAALNAYTATNATADSDMMALVNKAITDAGITGITAAWKSGSGFDKTNATASATGSVTGTITLKLNSAEQDVAVNLTIARLADKAALTAAITTANTAKIGITVSDNAASSVNSGTRFVTTAEMKALTDAIAAAQAVANNPAGTADQVSAAITTLNGAAAAFNTAIKTGTYTSGGGGGGGGSSSDGGASSGTPTPPSKPTEPVTGSSTNATVDNKGNATVNVTDKNISDAVKSARDAANKKGVNDGEVTAVINVKTPANSNPNTVSVNLPKTVQQDIISNKISNVAIVIDKPDISIGMTLATITEMNRQANADIALSATRTDTTKLSTEAKNAIGSRPAFDLKATFANGSKSITNFGAGTVTVAIPYTLQKGEIAGGLYAIYVDGNGKANYLTNSSYDAEAKVLRFATNHFSVYGIGYKAPMNFTDIAAHWAKTDIEFVVNRGFMSGTGNTAFAPNTAMTRGMFVTALGRLAGVDTNSYRTGKFTDVKADAYYAPYVNWAATKGIVKGTNDTTFAPDQAFSRQEMAAIMSSYAKAMGYTVPKTRAAVTFADNGSIASWAAPAVRQMQMAGILNGKNSNTFDPTSTATRGEISAMLHRYVELVIDRTTTEGWTQNDSGSGMYYKSGKALVGEQTIGSVAYNFNSFGETTQRP